MPQTARQGRSAAAANACAFVAGPPDGAGAALMDLARGLGFEPVKPFGGAAQAEQQSMQTPICFFLCAEVEDVGTLAPMAKAIRFCPSRDVRFSPLIYFSESPPSVETIKRCINMGFDDVITLPFLRERVEERLNRQLEKTLVYYETPAYFGPDRRGRIEEPVQQAGPRRAGGQFRRFEILRSLKKGVVVLREDLHAA